MSAAPLASPPSRARILGIYDTLFRLLCQAASCAILVVALLLVIILVDRSLLAIRTFGLSFLTHSDWNPHAESFGSLAFVWGTLATSAIAMIIAVPLGVGTAAFLSEIASGRMRRIASFFIEMLAAIPSVIYGFWGVMVLAPLMGPLCNWMGGSETGRGVLTAGLVLSLMIVPYIAAISYDVCQAVPRSQREGSLALGATRWQTIWGVVLPYARPGIIAGAFLALGRALGETMAVTMLIGNMPEIHFSPFAPGDSIASKLANQYLEADTRLFRSVLVELALLLLLVTVIINSLARVVLGRFSQGKPIFPAWLASKKPASPAFVRRSLLPRPGWLTAETVNRLMTWVLGGCVALTMAMLVIILAYLVVKGVGGMNWDFFTRLPGKADDPGGLANAILGSILVVGWATVFAVPVGLLAAIYQAEYRAGPLSRSVRFITDQLGGVPSIVMGIFAAALFTLVSDFIFRNFRVRIRFHGWAGVFALAVMMVPILLRATEEALKLVPSSLRTASYALGSSQAQTVLKVTLPAALPAIITAIFLSVARIAGETAPLMMTAGRPDFWPRSLNDKTATLPPWIYSYAMNQAESLKQLAWTAAFLLMLLVLLLNFGIRFMTGKRVVLASRAD